MRRVASLAQWQEIALSAAVDEALRQREDATLCASIKQCATRRSHEDAAGVFAGRAYEQLLHLDMLSTRLRSLALPILDEPMPARQRIIVTNPTMFTLDALRAAGVVEDDEVIVASKDATARLRLATSGRVRGITSGRLDLAALRRFDIPRDTSLRPLLPPRAPLPTTAGEVAQLGFLADEAEYEWIRMVPTGERRIPVMPRFTLTHRDARLVTGWSAAALDSRLARGPRWDAVLDAARVDRTGAERGNVAFDPYRFMIWWTSLAN
jgi:hypothetical protein